MSTITAFVPMIAMAVASAVGSYLLKLGVNKAAIRSKGKGFVNYIIGLIRLETAAGLLIYAAISLLFVYMLRTVDLTILYPVTASLSYIFTMAISSVLLHERVTKRKVTGIILIIIGVFLISIK